MNNINNELIKVLLDYNEAKSKIYIFNFKFILNILNIKK
jgi:hypothetical protein